MMLKVLIACEESQRVCMAFRELGHEAYSADIQEPSGGHPEWHILGDVLRVLNGGRFTTMDGAEHEVRRWDLIIAHPPCTYLSNAGAARLFPKAGCIDEERFAKGIKARSFFMSFYDADCYHIAIENPIPTGVYHLPDYQQVIQPYEFGHPYSKATCLWLKGLCELVPTKKVKPICSWVSGGSRDHNGNKRANSGTTFRDSKTRSKTFPGIARAMAEQWGRYLTTGERPDGQLTMW
jgi:hypothetical protein